MVFFSFLILLSRQNKVKYSKNMYPVKMFQVENKLGPSYEEHQAFSLSKVIDFSLHERKITSCKMFSEIYHIRPKLHYICDISTEG